MLPKWVQISRPLVWVQLCLPWDCSHHYMEAVLAKSTVSLMAGATAALPAIPHLHFPVHWYRLCSCCISSTDEPMLTSNLRKTLQCNKFSATCQCTCKGVCILVSAVGIALLHLYNWQSIQKWVLETEFLYIYQTPYRCLVSWSLRLRSVWSICFLVTHCGSYTSAELGCDQGTVL